MRNLLLRVVWRNCVFFYYPYISLMEILIALYLTYSHSYWLVNFFTTIAAQCLQGRYRVFINYCVFP